jgi:hypothetical protein
LKNQNANSLSTYQYIISIFLFSALILLRSPTLHPDFWAEDGAFFYKGAYELSLHSLLIPENGYLQTFARMGGILSLAFDIFYAPLVFYLLALAAQVSPVALLLSRRFDGLVPDIKFRLFISFCYVIVPNSWEVNLNLTNAQWHLAILSFLLVLCPESKQTFLKTIDYVVLIICGLSGPFSVFLSPIAAYEFYKKRTAETLRKAFLVCATAAIQLVILLRTMDSTRSTAPLGASVKSFIQILGDNIFVGGLLGGTGTTAIGTWLPALNYFFVPLAIILITVVLARSHVIYGEFIFFASGIMIAALIKPQASLIEPQWPLLESVGGNCNRYFFIPILAWLTTLVTLSFKEKKVVSYFSRLLIAVMLLLQSYNFLYIKYGHPDFREKVIEFHNAKSGTEVTFQENPPGWSFLLKK